jgi:ATP-dependent Clp protease protease subunit
VDEQSKTSPPASFFMPTVVYKDGNREMAADIFSMLLKKRIIFVQGEIEPNMAVAVVAQLLYLESEGDEDISMYIQSPGGQITAGLAIMDAMRYIKVPVQTLCIGQCASMAAWLLAAGTKGKRMILPNAEVMIHQPLGGMRGQATDIKIAALHMERTKDRMVKLMASFTGNSEKQVILDIERDNFLTAEQALAYGIVDSVVGWAEKLPDVSAATAAT